MMQGRLKESWVLGFRVLGLGFGRPENEEIEKRKG
jgi:hypothetical protein